jgi:hypothetical protein
MTGFTLPGRKHPGCAVQARRFAGLGNEWNSIEEIARDFAWIVACPPDLTLKNLTAEIYDRLTGDFALSLEREAGDLPGSMMERSKRVVTETGEAAQ